MKAMILAAGKGTRLLPLTLDKPKALVEINGIPLIEHCIRKLMKDGIREMVINVHHFSGQIIDFLNRNKDFGADIVFSDETHELLDSGGGIYQALPFFGKEDFIVYNVDILSTIDLRKFYAEHKASGARASLAVRKRNSGRYLLSGPEKLLRGWENVHTGERILQPGYSYETLEKWAFSGIHVLNPDFLENAGKPGPFSIIDFYLNQAAEHPVRLVPHDADMWFDLGKFDQIPEISALLKNMKS